MTTLLTILQTHGLTVTSQQLTDALRRLADEERAILAARFGLSGAPENYRPIARKLRVNCERIRRIERRALNKLRYALRTITS